MGGLDTKAYAMPAAREERGKQSVHSIHTFFKETAMTMKSNVLLGLAAVAAAIGILTAAAPASGGDVASSTARTAPEFQNIDHWLNSQPLKLQDLRGKVVLVDFWTYTCINCLNHLPYIKEWNAKYKDQGLVVVGVHTPEFAYEKSTRNVQEAISRLQITHAVAQDNHYATWKAFDNQYWPAVYLIDKQGKIVYSHFGEGSYGTTEKKIQALLAEQVPATGG